MGDYRQLAVWKRAYALTAEIYRSTRPFPDSERYGLTSQMRRAAISILSNIAEGSGRQSDREQVRFLRIARGLTCELECQPSPLSRCRVSQAGRLAHFSTLIAGKLVGC